MIGNTLTASALVVTFALCSASHAIPPLKVSDNRRFLVREDGTPFFYLGDTAWRLFSQLDREEVDVYFRDRLAKRFNVIQAVVLSGIPERANVYGHTALLPEDPAKPYNAKTNTYDPAKPNEAYFEHVDYIIDKAESLGLYIGMLPVWGSTVTSVNAIFNTSNAFVYGKFLGNRYKNRPIIWTLGGDQNAGGYEEVWRAMARGIVEGAADGDQGKVLMTYHPRGGQTSATWFHNDDWLDFNMIQSGHSRYRHDYSQIDMINRDYNRKPPRPCIDGEGGYELIPASLSNRGKRSPYEAVPREEKLNDWDIRRKAYWSVFAGAFGYVYGSNPVHQVARLESRDSWRWDPGMTWEEGLDLPGALQMQYLRNLIESRPFIRVPDQGIIASDAGEREKRVQATRGEDDSYAFIYITSGSPVVINMSRISGSMVAAYWYNPRDGASVLIGNFPSTGTRQFSPPTSGTGNDWVLVLDDAAKNFPPPGEKHTG